MRFPIVAATILLLAACGGSSGSNDANNAPDANNSSDANNTPACTFTLSGALTASGRCDNLFVVWDMGKNQASFSLTLDASAYANATLTYPGDWHTGSWTETTSGVDGAITAMQSQSATQSWQALADGSSTPQGSWTLNLTDLGQSTSGSSGKVYSGMHGTLNATLAPTAISGATGNVTLAVTF